MVPRTGNSGAPYTPSLGNLPSSQTPEECREDHLIEAVTPQPVHHDPEGRESVDPQPDRTLPGPLLPPNQKSEGKEPTDAAHMDQLLGSGGAKR